jgi:hypothetical protein
MKKQENEVRKIFIKIRMNDEELKEVKKKQQQINHGKKPQ